MYEPKVAYKPSSVPGGSTVYVPACRNFFPLGGLAATIYLGLPLLEGSSSQRGDGLRRSQRERRSPDESGPGTRNPPIRPCSGWGLPCL